MIEPGGWLLKSADVGNANRARILRLLYESGALTRADLATRLGVSRATISTIVQPLLDQGVLLEQAPRSAGENGGKPARPLWFGADRCVGSVYLSADDCTVAAVTMVGEVVELVRRPIEDPSPEGIMRLLAELTETVLTPRSLSGVGVAFAGMVDTATGSLLASYRRPSVNLLPVSEMLTGALHVPVFVDHHPRIQAFGDVWFGVGRRLDSFASVFTGEVIGVGIVHDGEVIRGARGAGGEAGHMVIDMGGRRCVCGRRGCWETVATLPWLREQAAAAGLASPELVTCARLAEAADAGGAAEAELLGRYAFAIAVGLANLEQTLGVGHYIVHGDVAQGGERTRSLVEAALVDSSPAREPRPRVTFVPDPDRTTLLGAAALVLSNLYPPTPRRRRGPTRRGAATPPVRAGHARTRTAYAEHRPGDLPAGGSASEV